jgi:hypothetical protein
MPPPEKFQYVQCRELFKSPEVVDVATLPKLVWGSPDEEALLKFLAEDKGFMPDRVTKYVARLRAARKKGSQQRLDTMFFSAAPAAVKPAKRGGKAVGSPASGSPASSPAAAKSRAAGAVSPSARSSRALGSRSASPSRTLGSLPVDSDDEECEMPLIDDFESDSEASEQSGPSSEAAHETAPSSPSPVAAAAASEDGDSATEVLEDPIPLDNDPPPPSFDAAQQEAARVTALPKTISPAPKRGGRALASGTKRKTAPVAAKPRPKKRKIF